MRTLGLRRMRVALSARTLKSNGAMGHLLCQQVHGVLEVVGLRADTAQLAMQTLNKERAWCKALTLVRAAEQVEDHAGGRLMWYQDGLQRCRSCMPRAAIACPDACKSGFAC